MNKKIKELVKVFKESPSNILAGYTKISNLDFGERTGVLFLLKGNLSIPDVTRKFFVVKLFY